MRLWHQYLIKHLPNMQLLGQHRELCALRGLGFGKKHSVVNYVFLHPYYHLYLFHMIVIEEMIRRGITVDTKWYNYRYRGKVLEYDYSNFTNKALSGALIYKEHNNKYLVECLYNLSKKDVRIKIKKDCYLYNYLLYKNLLNLVEIID